MRATIEMRQDPASWVAVFNAIAHDNESLVRDGQVPLLYGSGVRYRREDLEWWINALIVLLQGHGDCEDLAAWRAGELRALGWRALLPSMDGYATARARHLNSIEAEVVLTREGDRLYHAITRYRVGTTWYYDDPSARLGMLGNIDPEVLALEAQNQTLPIAGVPMPLESLSVAGRGRSWGPKLELPLMELRPAEGYRLAVQELKPGLFLVAAMREEEMEGVGVALTAAITTAAMKALVERLRKDPSDRVSLAKLRELLRRKNEASMPLGDRLRAIKDRLRGGFRPGQDARADTLRLPAPVEVGCKTGCRCGQG